MQKVLLIFLCMILAVNSHSQKIRVVENSALAKVAAIINGEKTYAITFGKTIFVSCKKEKFLAKEGWVRHELTHVAQYRKHGIVRFLFKYLYYTVFRRNTENPFELEAEAAEWASEPIELTHLNSQRSSRTSR